MCGWVNHQGLRPWTTKIAVGAGKHESNFKEPSTMKSPIQQTRIVAMVLLLCLCSIAKATEGTLLVPTKVTFTLSLNSLRFMDTAPEAIGIAGNRAPLKGETQYPPFLILSAVKGSPGVFSGTVEFPGKTARDLAFTVMFRVEGLWQKEPNNLGLQHVVLLDTAKSEQQVYVVYDPTAGRIVGQAKLGLAVDGYTAASAFASSLKQSAVARQYDYFNCVALLGSGRIAEAAAAYSRYTATSPAGQLARENYDNFSILRAKALAKSGKNKDALSTLRSVPSNAGGDSYQANIQLALGHLLQESGSFEEARTVYSNLQKRTGLTAELRDQCTFALATSYTHEVKPELLTQGKNLLRSLIATTTNRTYKRSALLALADTERKDKNKAGVKLSLNQASSLGTGQQRLAVKMRLLDMQYAEGDYAGVHEMCNMIATDENPGRHLPHLLCLDAVSLKRAGKTAESRALFKKLYAQFPGNAYTAYAATLIAAPVYRNSSADSLAKGVTHQ
jgi:TolA-binding protein